jgi:hypothetical protein
MNFTTPHTGKCIRTEIYTWLFLDLCTDIFSPTQINFNSVNVWVFTGYAQECDKTNISGGVRQITRHCHVNTGTFSEPRAASVPAMEACGGNRATVPLVHNLSTRWQLHVLVALPPEKEP